MGNIFQNMGKEHHAQKYFLMAEAISREDSGEIGGGEEGPALDLPLFGMRLGERMQVEHDGEAMTLVCESERPLIVRVVNFSRSAECAHIMERAEPRLRESFVIGTNGVQKAAEGSSEPTQSSYRSSKNTWLSVDKVLSRFQTRIAMITGLPLSYVTHVSEELQVVKYDSAGSSFRIHHDSSSFQRRLLTALVYLNDAEDVNGRPAGETWFPFTGSRDRNFDAVISSVDEAITRAQGFEDAIIAGHSIRNSDEEGTTLKIKPVEGDAILFFNHLPSGELDPAAVHAGLPTLSDSSKWIANYWVQLDKKQLLAHLK